MSGKALKMVAVDATTLKMSLGTIGNRVQAQDVQITKHGTPQAVLISPERYETLLRLEPVQPSALDQLQGEFDAMLDAMQKPAQAKAMAGLMNVSEGDLNAFLTAHYDSSPLPPMVEPVSANSRKVAHFGSKRAIAKPATVKTSMVSTVKSASKSLMVHAFKSSGKGVRPVMVEVKKAVAKPAMKAKVGRKTTAK